MLGPTKDFPRGRLNKTDEGGLKIGITTSDDCVIVAFNTPTAWIGMPKREALAASLAAMRWLQLMTACSR